MVADQFASRCVAEASACAVVRPAHIRVAQVVDDVGHHRVRDPDSIQDRRGVRCEQTRIVGR